MTKTDIREVYNFTNPHDSTKNLESVIANYTGADYCVCVDNCSNALFLALTWDDITGKEIEIPCRTYMSVPCEIIHAGGHVKFYDVPGSTLKGFYLLRGSNVIDSALHFTADMYIQGTLMCCSFTGPHKHLKLGKGGCILTNDRKAYEWLKKVRFSGRNEVSYHKDTFTSLGWNYYMNPWVAQLGLLLMVGFYNMDGSKKIMPDLELPYPDLSKFPIYTK
jgi:dTDP-4-amino-4,6-dideoxygalactose transaminase